MADMHTPSTDRNEPLHNLGQPLITIFLDKHPDSFEELVASLTTLGHTIEVVPFEHAGERTFGHLERVTFDGSDCIVKYVGPMSSDLYVASSVGVQQERDGLILARDVATRLIAEIRVDDQVVAVCREFSHGESVRTAVKSDTITAADARAQVERLAKKLTDLGLWLWDPNLDNMWRRPDGAVVLLEGQCVVPSSDAPAELLAKNMLTVSRMLPEEEPCTPH